VPLSAKEDELRQGGGIFATGRREFIESVRRTPEVSFPPPELARTMTASEQIVWAHRVDKDASLAPGATVRVYGDLFPASDGTAPFSIHTFNQITGGETIRPRRLAVANDHFVFTGVAADDKQTSIGRAFAERHGVREPYYAKPGAGIFHFYFPEQGLIVPGGFYPGADSHSRAYGAYGAFGMGVGSTTLGLRLVDRLRLLHAREAAARAADGTLQPWVSGKDIVLALLARWGAKQSQGHGRRVRRRRQAAADAVPQHDREHDGRGRGAERHLPGRRHHRGVVPGARHRDAVPAGRARHGRALRDRRGARPDRDRAHDRPAVQPRQRVRRRGDREGAADVRQGDDRLVHERRLRRPAAGLRSSSAAAGRTASGRRRSSSSSCSPARAA
jgi:hypothetical protein